MSDKLPQVIVAQLGARMHYAVPALLHRAGMLSHFYTDAYVGRGSFWHLPAQVARLLPEAWRPTLLNRLLDRREDSLPPDKVTAFNLAGLSYSLATSRAKTFERLLEAYLHHGIAFHQRVADQDLSGADAVYACHGALPLFRKAKNRGLVTILERFSAPVATQFELYSEEYRLWPEWEAPYPNREIFRPALELQQGELDLADLVICGSEFVAQGLTSLGVSPEKLQVVPYGVEVSRFTTARQPWDGRRPLRLLFTGGVTLRKGVQYLFKALEKLAGLPLSVRIVGPIAIQEPFRRLMSEQAELTGQVPRHKMRHHYGWADLFVFPSICEGSATVTYEALASGLPVITTPNAGSVVRDGQDGFIVPIRDSEALAEKIELLFRTPELLAKMSRNALQRAQDFSWEKYGERLIGTIRQTFNVNK